MQIISKSHYSHDGSWRDLVKGPENCALCIGGVGVGSIAVGN